MSFDDRFLDLLGAAQELPRDEAHGFLSRECAGEPLLLERLERCLSFGDPAAQFLKDPSPLQGLLGGAISDDGEFDPALTNLRPGAAIDDYEIVEVLGEGGMGVVYLADQKAPVQRRVALKAIKPGMDTRRVLARFEAERQALARMSHPGIAQVLDAGHTPEGRPYFVMEYVPGEPITAHCDRARLTLDNRLELFRCVCEAIHHAHERDVVHRDIKASNVLVSTPDGTPLSKIIDFGIAKAIAGRLTEETVAATAVEGVIGTPTHMSPEVADGAPDIDRRADVYSLGVLLYDLLVGELPFSQAELRTTTVAEMLRTIREVEPPTPSARWLALDAPRAQQLASARSASVASVGRALRGDLDWIVMRAMEKDVERRYPSAAALLDDLERHGRNEPVLAGPPSALYVSRKLVRKHRAVVTGTIAVMLALALGLCSCLLLYLDSRARNAQLLSLSDLKRLDGLARSSEELWPALPDKIPALEDWLTDANALCARLEQHKATLATLRAEAGEANTKDAEDRGWSFTETETQWWHDTLEQLVVRLHEFRARGRDAGLLDDVEQRLAFARRVRHETLVEPARAWRDAVAAIGDPIRNPHYNGLKLEPIIGLVPLGPDPHSGLWEFAHLQSGTPPARGVDGKLQLVAASAIVLVLVPKGSFAMGAQRATGGRNHDPYAEAKEEPVHVVELAAFLISKFEMTQAQWLRVAESNPSRYGPEHSMGGRLHSLLHPVENVSWNMCRNTLGRLGMTLPTEAQWEYATRAGTSTPWWTGASPESLAGKTNLADAYCRNNGGPTTWRYESWEDGWVAHAPVNAHAANPFGLHGTLGNVKEWCLDEYGGYDVSHRAGNGLREVAATNAVDRVLRGGSCDVTADRARAATRAHGAPMVRSLNLGVRPAMTVPDLPRDQGNLELNPVPGANR